MSKRGFFSLVAVVSLVFFVQFAFSYEYDIANVSLNSPQIYGESISGSFVLSLLDAPINLVFSSEFGEITLQQLLANSGKTLGCEAYNCSGFYTSTDEGATSLEFEANSLGVAYGILLNGEGVSAGSFSINISSVFPESDKIPLTIQVGDTLFWNYNSVSSETTNFRQVALGCFNPDASLSEGVIDTIGYCELVNLTDSASYFLGANLSGSGSASFVFSLKKDGADISNCLLNLDSAYYSSSVGCFVSLSDKQSAGIYEVCINAQEDSTNKYKIKKETSGTNCGRYALSDKLAADYSLFTKVPFYSASSGEISLGEGFSGSAVDEINSYISTRYGGDCSSKCVVPIVFYGENVTVNVNNIDYSYVSETGLETNNHLYSLVEDFFRIDFSDVLSFSSFNWTVNEYGNLSFNIKLIGDDAQNELFSGNLFVQSLPFVTDIFPTNPPAGIETYFYASVSDLFVKLIWNFGDGSPIVETNKSFAKHKYTNISQNFNITVTAVGQNSSVDRYFVINVTSPENYINETLAFKRSRFNNLSLVVDTLPTLIRDFVRERLQMTSIQNELNQIEIDRAKALTSDEFLSITNRIGALVIPYSLKDYETRSGSLEFSYSNVDPSIIAQIEPGEYNLLEEYKSPIYAWQMRFIDSNVVKKKYRVINENNERQDLLVAYDLTIKSKANESAYLVIQKPISELHFSLGVDAKSANGNATYVSILPQQETKLSFFFEGSGDAIMFVSPSLDSLELEEDISICTVDGICQSDKGENSKNCSQDCKNSMPMILAIVFVLIMTLVIYTALQIWYVKRYEQYLFRDRAFIFNLLAFINNAKLNSRPKEEIYSTLLSKGWSREQIDYAVKKAEGKNTGMFELLPVQKIVAYSEMKKAKKAKDARVVAPTNFPLSSQKPLTGRPQPRKNVENGSIGQRRGMTKI